MRDIKVVLRQKSSSRPKRGNVALKHETFHAKRGRAIGTFVHRIAGVAKYMVDRDVKLAFGPKN